MQKYVKKDSRCVYTKAGPFSRTFIGREPEIAAARSDEAIGMARKENLSKARARDREYGEAIVEVAWRVERSYLWASGISVIIRKTTRGKGGST